jgi:hypothetical protein
MALVTIEPTAADERIANAIASHTTPAAEEVAQLLTWGADEKVLLALAIAGWLYAARRPALQPVANHMVVVSLLSSILPHLLKSVVDQTRPDRLTVKGHWRGVPFSGRPRDAFPSGPRPSHGCPRFGGRPLPITAATVRAWSGGRSVGDAHFASGALGQRCCGRVCGGRSRRTADPPDYAGFEKQRRREA